MNAEEMIESVFSGLDGERLEQALHGDRDLSIRFERLRVAIDRLVDDGPWFEHPPDLASRTVSFVARNRQAAAHAARAGVDPRSHSAGRTSRSPRASSSRALLTLLPAIQRSRERMNQAGCVFNLQQLGNSLAQYATLQASLPYPPSHRSDTHAGMFAVMLHDAGVLRDLSVLDCPCNGPCPQVKAELASFDQVDHIRRTNPEQYRAMLRWDYAYNVGYRQATGQPAPCELGHSASMPVLADHPITSTLPRFATATAPTTGGAARTFCTGTAAFAGW